MTAKEAVIVRGLAVLTARGFLLWIVLPIGTLTWLVLLPLGRKRRGSLGAFLGWSDLNLTAALQRVALYPKSLIQPFRPPSAISGTTHRILFSDQV